MAEAAKSVRPGGELRRFLEGLWWSGLRIDELNRLHWNASASITVDLDRRIPLIVLRKQKNRRESYLPAPPQFWALVGRTGVSRSGPVFPLAGRGGQQLTTRTIGRLVKQCGQTAGVVVNSETGKTATAHDLRAAYLTRVVETDGLTQSQTAALARHQDPKTTAVHYVRHEAEDLAKVMGW